MGKSEQTEYTYKMGIDLDRAGRKVNRNFRAAKTGNLYHGLLIKLYSFLARRTDSKFNKIVYKRLNQSGTTRYPMSVSRLVKVANSEDKRLIVVPKMNICALRFSTAARERIVAAGGRCMTFDQLAKECPKGQGTWLLRGHRSREAMRHFGSPARDG